MKNLLFLFFFSLTSCGLEVPQPISRLYSPNGLRAIDIYDTMDAGIRLTWFANNPEDCFSGYNIYITDTLNDALNFRGTKIPNRNSASTLEATVQVSSPFNTSREFTYDYNPLTIASGNLPPLENKEYYFFVKAYSQIENIESPPSLVVKIQYTR